LTERESHLRSLIAAVPVIAYRAAAGGMPILLGLFIAHRWGVREVAPFAVANAIVAVALVVADWGATRALPRNLATLAADAGARFLGSANALRLLIAGAMLGLAAALSAAGIVQHDVAVYLAILFPLCAISLFSTNALSERIVVRDTRRVGVAVAAGLATFAALALLALRAQYGPRLFVAAYVAGKLVELLLMVSGRWWVLAVHSHELRATATSLWPFGAQMILGVIYSRLSVFTVEHMASRMELGVFSVASALQSALLLIPTSLALIYFPELTRIANDSRGVRAILVRYTIISATGVTCGLTALGVFAARVTAVLKVPRAFTPFVVAFAALALLSIFSTIAGFLMQARGQEHRAARLSIITLGLALVYQLTALHWWGLPGIIAAVAAAELTTVVVFGAALRRV
jgi:O-antigen/teichoic acid export membrane protein